MQEKIIIIKIYKQKKRGKAIEHKEMDIHKTLVATIRWNLLMEKPTRFYNFWAHIYLFLLFSPHVWLAAYMPHLMLIHQKVWKSGKNVK